MLANDPNIAPRRVQTHSTVSPVRCNSVSLSEVNPESVIKTSMSSRLPCRTPLTAPTLLRSASRIRRRAHANISRLIAASAGSGVVSPRESEIPLVPRNATSTLISLSERAAQSSTSARVFERTCPPSVNTVSSGLVSNAVVTRVARVSQVERHVVVVLRDEDHLSPVRPRSLGPGWRLRHRGRWSHPALPTVLKEIFLGTEVAIWMTNASMTLPCNRIGLRLTPFRAH